MRNILVIGIALGLTGCGTLPSDSALWPYTNGTSSLPSRGSLPSQGELPKMPAYIPAEPVLVSSPQTSRPVAAKTEQEKGEGSGSAAVPDPPKRTQRLKPIEVVTPVPSNPSVKQDEPSVTIDLRKAR